MNKKDLCSECGKNPVFVKKRELCRACYQKFYKKHGKIINPLTYDYKSDKFSKKHTTFREIEFIKNFFNHKNWIHQPALFRFNSRQYSPDFYDGERNVFIEVAGSRQAYHKAKERYSMFRKHFPKIILEIRKTDGDLLNENDWHKNW